MDILQHNELDVSRLEKPFERLVQHLREGDFRAADVKKLAPSPYYRAKLNDADRLLFRFGDYKGRKHILLLEVIRNHAYDRSRFLNGAAVDENKLVPLASPDAASPADAVPLAYVNPQSKRFNVLDKIISFDDVQNEIFGLRLPFILIGAAGSGKTVLTLEKLKQLAGDVLYVTHSPYLAENSATLYYSNNYENELQNVEFLSFTEYLETWGVPPGRAVAYRDFDRWFGRHVHSGRLRDSHKLFEEFNGVITGCRVDGPCLSKEDYLGLGVRRSIFLSDERSEVYDVFARYREWIETDGFYDLNMAAYAALPRVAAKYDFVVVDEVQDLTNVQLCLALKSLRMAGDFVLCGDSNQIVHPNFFSWANVKTLFYEKNVAGQGDLMRVLNTNYRNSPQVTDMANRLLLVKTARFGSVDRESNYLVRCNSENAGAVEFLPDDDKTKRELNEKTRRSARCAVMVMRSEDKAQAQRFFQTPLLFSIQEAKGLEYENIILFNFVSGNAEEFDEITDGVSASDLAGELKYARAKDKTDKALEAYKFYINALYVAMTRAVRNLYIIESKPSHRLLRLLGLVGVKDGIKLAEQKSSTQEWQEEARKLELQGKQEQADAIRQSVLALQPVPWKVLTPQSLAALEKEAFDPDRFNKQAKQLVYEYALLHSAVHLFDRLVEHKFNRAKSPEQDHANVLRKYHQDYGERSLAELNRKMAAYGVDFRNSMNQTPLMIAGRLGMAELVGSLLKHGANPDLTDNWGRTPVQIALREAALSADYARRSVGSVYALLAPRSVKVRVEGRLVKVDKHQMEYFLVNFMLALADRMLRFKIEYAIPAFQTRDFIGALAPFPAHVIPERRKNRSYITGVLARNEIGRFEPGSKKLFLRVRRGYYVLNPCMDLEVNGAWINVYDLIQISEMEKETHNPLLTRFIEYIRKCQRTNNFALAAQDDEAEEVPAATPDEPGPSSVSARPDDPRQFDLPF